MPDARWIEHANAHLAGAIAAFQAFDVATTLAIADRLVEVFQRGGKLLIAGNGGSASDAMHLAAEFVNRLTSDYERPAIPAIALTTDAAVITSIANDYDFSRVFSRQIEAIGRPEDALIVISTSGGARNGLAAVETARAKGLLTIGVTGGTGGALKDAVDLCFVAGSPKTGHVQESHLAFYHILVGIIERRLNGE